MAGADDEIEKLLREVDGALGGGTASRPSAKAAVEPRREGGLRALVPRAAATGAVWGVGFGGAFLILPFVQGFSGAIAGFVTGFSMSILGRWRRR